MKGDSDVYFDVKKAWEQKMETIITDQKEEEEATERAENVATGAYIVGNIAGLIVIPALLMLLWNWVVPSIFGIAAIGYFQAAALYAITKILFKHD